MSGPISVHRITSDSSIPRIEKNELVLRFPLQSWGPLEDGEITATMLQHVLRDWRDGRYPFEAEMITSGLSRCLKRAQYEVEAQRAQEEFGNEMIVSEDGKSQTAKWHIEAGKRHEASRRYSPYIMSEPRVEIVAAADIESDVE